MELLQILLMTILRRITLRKIIHLFDVCNAKKKKDFFSFILNASYSGYKIGEKSFHICRNKRRNFAPDKRYRIIIEIGTQRSSSLSIVKILFQAGLASV